MNGTNAKPVASGKLTSGTQDATFNLRAAEAIGTVAIYNAIGQQVLLRQGSGDTMQIDLYNLANGHYTMRIVTVEGHEAIRKFIVNK